MTVVSAATGQAEYGQPENAPDADRPALTRPERIAAIWHKAISWLPEGRELPYPIWTRRQRWISRFALIQAIGIGLFALARGNNITTVVVDVAIVGVPALMGMNPTVSRRLRTICETVSLMFASATIVDIAGGVTEAHFHFFVMIGVVALYQDWMAFGVCVIITVAQHSIMGLLDPNAVYGSPLEQRSPVQWALIHGGFILAASVTHLIAWRSNEQQELSDPLTRLPNRTAFTESLDRRLADPGRTVSVLFVDLDNFKGINDSGGHHVGDAALRHAAQRMQNCLREGDLVARIGGDEFAVLVRGNAETAALVANRISAQLQAPIVIGGRELFIHASIGVADTDVAGSRDPGDVLRHADLAMYLAKSSGKNQVTVYTPGIDSVVRERSALAVDLGSALNLGQLDIYYQPLMSGVGPTLDGVEALLRWNHPTRGLVPPAEFIPLAEESGQIAAIGAWVLNAATLQVASWRRTIPACRDLGVSVNLSPLQLLDPNLIDVVTAAVAASNLPPSSVTLEVTESTLLHDLDHARHQLDTLRSLGVRVAIDDFGTGYSSLSYLAKLPADEVKIDRSFVANLGHGSGPVALVRGIIDMAGALNMGVIAEGVEASVQQDILGALGCPRFQGYLYSRPLPAADFEHAVAAGRILASVGA